MLDKDNLLLIICLLVVFAIQLVLCFKVKFLIIKLLPVLALFIATIVFIVLMKLVSGWDALGYLLLALVTGIGVLVCGFAWFIWGVIKLIKRKGAKNGDA